MEKDDNKINQLKDRLDALADQHQRLAEEMAKLTNEIQQLKSTSSDIPKPQLSISEERQPPPIPKQTEAIKAKEEAKRENAAVVDKPSPEQDEPSLIQNLNQNLEDFIGTNLISKIGVAAIVIGMGIGIKYAIDNELISPSMRIIMGYAVGAVLLFLSYRSRRKYNVFGAVLFSGATALMFFTSYAAHIYYDLLSQGLAFGIMVALTVYTVIEALRFNQQIVAHFGLVGAYAVPFLLGDDPEGITFLFTYVAIVNLGILCIAFFRYWKSLYYAAFGFTWLIFYSWYLFNYEEASHYSLALTFSAIFFGIFYLAFLAYKLVRREKYDTSDVVMLLLNSFFFYGLGYVVLQDHEIGQHQLGLFTIINALIHLAVSALVWSFRLADRNLFYLVSGVGLIFTVIAVPVQFEGNWVTLLWAGEAALLFWIGRTRAAPVYESLAYVLFILASGSLWKDWGAYSFSSTEQFVPVFNIYFLTTLWVAACFGFSMQINRMVKYWGPEQKKKTESQLLGFILPLLFLLTLYLGIQFEIAYYFDRLKVDAAQNAAALSQFKVIWHINFTLLFLSILSLVNIFRLQNLVLAALSLTLGLISLLLFMTVSLGELFDLHETYANQAANLQGGIWHVLIRYISYFLVGSFLWTIFRLMKQPFLKLNLRIPFDLLLHITLLSILSLELHCWMKSLGVSDSYQAGLSILWGVYTLMLIILGIRQSQKHLRIAAIVLIGITLCKVAIVDLADLDTLNKTIVLVILGALLLFVSFLYNKFREKIFK